MSLEDQIGNATSTTQFSESDQELLQGAKDSEAFGLYMQLCDQINHADDNPSGTLDRMKTLAEQCYNAFLNECDPSTIPLPNEGDEELYQKTIHDLRGTAYEGMVNISGSFADYLDIIDRKVQTLEGLNLQDNKIFRETAKLMERAGDLQEHYENVAIAYVRTNNAHSDLVN